MKIFLDDVRHPPDPTWTLARDVEVALSLMDFMPVTEISFDHDLGENKPTGYDLAKIIEERVARGHMSPPKWKVHSANPVGKKNIEAAMKSAEKLHKNRGGK